MQFHKASIGGEGVVFHIVFGYIDTDVAPNWCSCAFGVDVSFVLYVNIVCHVIMSDCSSCFLGITENVYMYGFNLKISFYMSLLDK